MAAIKNVVVISDTHCGCGLGLAPNKRFKLDDGGYYSVLHRLGVRHVVE